MVSGLLSALKSVSVEPVMLIDGACNQAMLLFAENVQMNKICSVNLGLSSEVCANLSAHPEENLLVQKEFSLFTFYNSIVLSALPLIFVLFMGAWSDKYGRKIPLLMTLICHVMYASGYLLNNWQTSWPVEIIYVVSLLESIGGGNMGLLSSTLSYISDICPEKTRTSRVSTANSMWYLGGPLGTLIGALVIQYAGYNVALGLVLAAYISAALYVIFFIKESHGPFAKKSLQAQGSIKDKDKDKDNSDTKEEVSTSVMIKDFFNWRRVAEAFQTAVKKREGNTRAILFSIIASNMIRRVARGFFMYMFVRRTLQWEATDYGYWVTYRNLLAALGSLFLVPLLTRLISIKDYSLVVLGCVSIIGEYLCYGMVHNASQTFLMWLGPPAGIISNAGIIAFRSMSTKLVTSKEKGRINAVMSAMNGLMPMVGYAAYSPIYYKTVDSFPAAQFYFGVSLNVLIMVLFIVLQAISVSSSYDSSELESGVAKTQKKHSNDLHNTTNVTLKNIIRTLSGPVEHFNSLKRSLSKAPSVHLSGYSTNGEEKNEMKLNSCSANTSGISKSQQRLTSSCIPYENKGFVCETSSSSMTKQDIPSLKRISGHEDLTPSSSELEGKMSDKNEPIQCKSDNDGDSTVSDEVFYGIPLNNKPVKDVNSTVCNDQ